MARQSDNHYTTLGLTPGASAGEIKRAYRRRMKKWHLDVNRSRAAEATARSVNRAYEVLSDSESRAEYGDAIGCLATEYPSPAVRAGPPPPPRHAASRTSPQPRAAPGRRAFPAR